MSSTAPATTATATAMAAAAAAAGGHGSASAMQPLVPDIPGELVINPYYRDSLRAQVAQMCNLPKTHHRFVGAQPVSFEKASLDLLRSEDYWVCEKSDGQRVLVLVTVNEQMKRQEVFLIDRKNDFRFIDNLKFPSHKPDELHTHCLLDAELVLDLDSNTGKHHLVLLLFDCIVLDGENLSSRPLLKRYGRLQQFFYAPYQKYCMKNEDFRRRQPFQIQVKKMELSYGVVDVLRNHIPNLKHGNDGLIFTCANDPYVFGTDKKILKWKPPSENSIDFRVRLRFPPDLELDPSATTPDYSAKPFFLLEQHMGSDGRRNGGEEYEFFDWMEMEDDEWEEFKRTGEQLDDRIVEVVWETTYPPEPSTNGHHPGPQHNGAAAAAASAQQQGRRRHPPRWKFKRIRDDKKDGNHHTIVRKILGSIEDGVEEEELVAAQASIKAAWKTPERAKLREMASVTTTTAAAPTPSMSNNNHNYNANLAQQPPHGRTVSRTHSLNNGAGDDPRLGPGGAGGGGSNGGAGAGAGVPPPAEHPCPMKRPGPPPPLRLGTRGVPPMMAEVRRALGIEKGKE